MVVKAHQVLFFLLLALIPTQLGYHLWPEWAHVLGRRVDYLAPTIFLTDILLVATVASFLREQRPRLHIKKIAILLVVVAFIAINTIFAASPQVAIFKWVKALEPGLLFWYIMAAKPSFSRVAFPLSLGVLYSSLLAIWQFSLQQSLGLWILGERTFDVSTPGIARTVAFGREILRPYATLPHPNVLGGLLAASLPVVLAAVFTNTQKQAEGTRKETYEKSKKIFYLAVSVLGAIALLLTFSRSAIAVGGIATGAWYMVLKKKTRWIIPLFLAAGALVFLVFPFSPYEESVVVRSELNASALTLFFSSPFIGVGLGNFLVRLPEVLPSRQIYFLQPVHNMYLLILTEAGILGAGLLIVASVRFMRGRKNLSEALRSPFFVSFLVLLILGFVDHYQVSLQQGQLTLILFASLAASSTQAIRKDEP